MKAKSVSNVTIKSNEHVHTFEEIIFTYIYGERFSRPKSLIYAQNSANWIYFVGTILGKCFLKPLKVYFFFLLKCADVI